MLTSYDNILCQHTSSRKAKRLAQKTENVCLKRLVRISATCSAVGKILRLACFIDTTLWTEHTLRSMSLARRELLELLLMAAVLSSKMTVGSVCCTLRSTGHHEVNLHPGHHSKQPHILTPQCTKRRSPAPFSSSRQDHSRQSAARQMSICGRRRRPSRRSSMQRVSNLRYRRAQVHNHASQEGNALVA
jgi:hypothetical protein